MQNGAYNFFIAAVGDCWDSAAGFYDIMVWSVIDSDLRAHGRSISSDSMASLGQRIGPVVRWIIYTPTAFLGFPVMASEDFCWMMPLLHEESVSWPTDYAPCANLDGDSPFGKRSDLYPFASRSIDRSAYLSALIALLWITMNEHVLLRHSQLLQNEGIRRRRYEHQLSCRFLSAPGDSASSLLGRSSRNLCKNISHRRLASLFAEMCEALAQKINLSLFCDRARVCFGNCCFRGLR